MTDQDRYLQAIHAMQTGVSIKQDRGSNCGTPKHLRVGVNIALRDLCSLVLLLVEKGIITMDEYNRALADGMEEEVRVYEDLLSDETGKHVTLR